MEFQEREQFARGLIELGRRCSAGEFDAQAFGGTVGSGEYADLQTFLGNGNVAAAQAQLEKDAVAGYGGQPPAAS